MSELERRQLPKEGSLPTLSSCLRPGLTWPRGTYQPILGGVAIRPGRGPGTIGPEISSNGDAEDPGPWKPWPPGLSPDQLFSEVIDLRLQSVELFVGRIVSGPVSFAVKSKPM